MRIFLATVLATTTITMAGLAASGCKSSSGGPAGQCGGATFCDDFESYAAGAQPGGSWTTRTTLGAVVVDDTQARSGSRSVKLTTQAKTSDGIKTAFIRLGGAPVFPSPGNVLYGRMMVRLEAAPTASVHWTMIQGSGVVPGQSYHAYYRYGGQLPVLAVDGTFLGSQLMANYDTPDSYPIGSGTGPASDCWHHSSKTVLPTGKWSCLEWKFDGGNNEMTLSLDGVALPDLTVTGTGDGCVNATPDFVWAAPVFDHLDLGWESYQADDARTFWIDDVAVSSAPIGCPP